MLVSPPVKKSNLPIFTRRILIIVGGYGSGKSEVAVNLSRHLVETSGRQVAIADLDIVNPYFRSREANQALEALGIRCINPSGGEFYADLPIILPEIKGAIEHNDELLVLDVGGDDVGARVLSSLGKSFQKDSYEMMLVLNRNRPFTSNVSGCIRMIREIEEASRLKFTGIISNTHLLDDTDAETIASGYELAKEVSNKTGLPIKFLAGLAAIVESDEFADPDVPVLPLERHLLKPWESAD